MIYWVLNNANLYVQPSIGEGFCNAVLEAQALGKLCVVSDAGGLVENIINNKTGIIVPKLSSLEIYKAIIQMISMTQEQKEEMSMLAKQNVSENYHIEKQQQEFLNFYS